MNVLESNRSSPRHWDYVITCFEPIVKVTGGIGTYTRLLLEELERLEGLGRPLEILFFTGERQRSPELAALCPSVHVAFVPDVAKVGNNPLNNLSDPYRHFGFGVMQQMRALANAGHTFGLVETPDYSAEGYYVLKARRFGLLNIGRTAVRLHSPLFMLHVDNDSMPWCDNSAFRFHDMERYVLRHADMVLYGGDAMLERVCSLAPKDLAEAIRAKAFKVPHPWPPPHTSAPVRSVGGLVKLGYVGRLEFRKGVDLLVQAALKALRKTDFELHLFGRDTDSWRQSSMRAQLERFIGEHPSRQRIIFHDYIPQKELWARHLPAMDAFVFPSRFENYPNVLLEVLSLGRPTLVSRFGCMPEMAAAFPFTRSFDPFDRDGFVRELTSLVQSPQGAAAPVERYERERARMREELQRGYGLALAPGPSRKRAQRPLKQRGPSIAFLVAHYNQSKFLPKLLSSLERELEDRDEVLVIDDCSTPKEAAQAQSIVKKAGHRFLQTPANAGPSVARNLGLEEARADALYIIDADDEVEPNSTNILRAALANHPDLQVVSGYFQAFGDETHAWASYDPIPETILLENSTHCGILIRREAMKKLGGYADAQRDHFEDWELAMRLALTGVAFEVLPIVTYRYRVRRARGRNTTRHHLMGYSYEHAVRRALAGIRPEALDWVRFSRLVETLVARSQSVNGRPAPPPVAREVRYEVADRLNLLVKPMPIHKPLRRLVAWTLKLPTDDE
jgi:glycosyltransferase involved in cell wall biosynthesis/GT2 family glycosyltransferase